MNEQGLSATSARCPEAIDKLRRGGQGMQGLEGRTVGTMNIDQDGGEN
jgi:hypothetical protein